MFSNVEAVSHAVLAIMTQVAGQHMRTMLKPSHPLNNFSWSPLLTLPQLEGLHWCRICTLTVTYVLILETRGSILDYHNPKLESLVL